ncbi:RNA polymerase II transcription factor B subunit 5 [Eremomyces bilateralis CBS 781.70]|uniref:General transcription and DNA repair factor IIH subunit TFB5 n=1 Tax=Eremomyces bilateralis CBS 781.70 TaxID=1392243 RepID=A0A6G1G2N4_9PEZI|nr:RNA polymerase II transcription factor B subunit 5 [Eremomyces bilateralis CBS 781.70]KAF1812186.1 RNA polymerase II transcription factor B subunit 5 [Eremomyces bilateralis CBS 781.70]
MVKAVKGALVECDASIKAIIVKIDKQRRNEIIIEDLDDETVLVKTDKLEELKRFLKEELKDTVREAEESGSE